MNTNSKFDLEERTYEFAKSCKEFIKNLPRNITNIEYAKQLARSSGSVAANYIEANESLSKKDYYHRVRISRKESKESRLWLRLCTNNDLKLQQKLIDETIELGKIFGSILSKSNI